MKTFFVNVRLSILAAILMVSMGTLFASDSSHSKSAKKTMSTEIPEAMRITDKKPNAPSLARTDAHRKLTVGDWEDPAICGSCHTVQYQGWKGSMHSNAFKDPIFQAEWALAVRDLGDQISNMCGGCHSPPGMLSKTIKFDPKMGKHGGFTAPPIAEQGVSCDVCHTISGSSFANSEVGEHGNGSYISSPGKIKRGPLKNAKSPYHETAYSEDHTKAAFCGNCHNIFNPLNNFPLERTYDEWKYSVYAQNDVQCQDCHMVPVATAKRVADELKPARELKDHGLGGKAGIGAEKDREIVHGHGFVGGNAVITTLMGDPDSRRHAAIAIERLRSVASLDITLKQVKGQANLNQLVVKVTNERAGHDIPTSLTFIRELWIDVEVTDQNGKQIFRSGAIDSHGEVDSEATMFKAYAVDKDGNPAQYIWTVERFERRTTIPPKGHGYGRYAFVVPKGTTALNVRAKLNYRSFSQHFVDHLLGEGELDVPVMGMNDIETVYAYPSMKVKSVKDHYAQTDKDKATALALEAYIGPEVVVKDVSKLVKACSACHGKDGIGYTENYPNLAGQNQIYLLSAMRGYKSGTRKNEIMYAMMKDLSDEVLDKLAEHFSKMSHPK